MAFSVVAFYGRGREQNANKYTSSSVRVSRVGRRGTMASRRVMLLVGPCRVDGGDGASTGNLGSLGDVDKARQTRRTTSIAFYARKRAPPTRSDPPHPSPHLI